MDNQNLEHLRHSAAHLLAAAVINIWPDTKVTLGPAIENGFYYDMEFSKPVTETDLPRIEQKMRELVKKWQGFERIEVSPEKAGEMFKGNPYKLELIKEISSRGEKISLYRSGDFVDLCRGGHVSEPFKHLRHFKLLNIAGAYWRGNEKNKMLTRIYGTAFPTKEELDKYLWQLEEAKKRDHRKIGEQLDLFAISEKVGKGLILWLPKGNLVKETLENWAKKTEADWGYQRITTPHITRSELYYTSGHLPYYKSDMYPPMHVDDDEEYYLKPMNCPHHHMVYASRPKSYKDLPLRYAEYGDVYRYEASGQLFGLMRVRGMSQNDAHIYCTLDQAVDEFAKVMELHEYYYKKLGITDYHLEMALRDPKNKEKYHGDDTMWELAEKLMRKAVERTNINMVEQIGNAAFYGPKIDFIVRSSIGREFAVSTNQIDLYMGKRFGLTYVDEQGKEQTPVIIHRAPLGSHERFIGFLIEHYAGAFPTWLAPVQVSVLPVSEKVADYAAKVYGELKNAGFRAEMDNGSETIGKKIRRSTLQKVPYMVIIGEREKTMAEDKGELYVSLRTRDGQDKGQVSVKEFINSTKAEIENTL